jgi:hypothetical protein
LIQQEANNDRDYELSFVCKIIDDLHARCKKKLRFGNRKASTNFQVRKQLGMIDKKTSRGTIRPAMQQQRRQSIDNFNQLHNKNHKATEIAARQTKVYISSMVAKNHCKMSI